MVWCGVNQMIIHFSEASILPSVRSSFHPFLEIFLVLNLLCGMELNEFCPPNSSDDLFLLSCLFLLLCFLNVVHNLGTWIPKLGKVWRKPASWGRLAAIARPSTAANWNHNTTASLVIEHIHCRVHQFFFFCEFQKDEYGVCLPRVLEEEKKNYIFFAPPPNLRWLFEVRRL